MLYSDRLIEITDDQIILKRYYFPFGGARSVKFADIARITTEMPTWRNGKWRLWGTGSFVTWFPLDWERPSRDKLFFISFLRSKQRIGFSVEDSQRVSEIFVSKGLA